MVLMVICWSYRTLFDANGCLLYANECRLNKMNVFLPPEFEVGVNDRIFSSN